MSLNTIGVTLTLDGEAEYKQALKAINAEQKELRTEMELSAANHKENANGLEALQEKYDLLTKRIETQKDKVEVYETAIEKQREAQEKAAENVEKYSASLDLLNGDMQKLKESGEATDEELKNQQNEIDKAEECLRKAQLAYADCGSKIDDYQSRLNIANTQLINWEEELQNTNKYLDEAKTSTDGCAISIDNLGNEIRETGESSEKAGHSLTEGVASILIADGIEKLADITAKAGKEFLELATNAAFYADEINTLSTNTGIAIDTIQALKYSEELLDTSLETVTSSMAKNIRSMNSAREGSEAYANAYAKLGISVTDANGDLRDSEEVFWEVIDALGKVENATEKDAISMQLFGRNAQTLNSLIAAGSKGFQEMYQEASDLGYIMDKETIDSLTRTSNAIERVSKTADAFKNKIGADVAPVVEEAANELSVLMMEHEEEVAEIIEDVIPDLVKGIEFIADNLDTIVPIVEMIGTSFIAFKTATAITSGLNAVLALMPPALNGATVAQEELNAAQAASPVGAIAAGMALLMTAIVEIAKASAEYTPKVIELTDKEKALVDSINAVREATKESAEAFSSNVESISTNKTQAAGLLEKLKELAPEAKNDASKMQEMQSVVDQLNVLMPDLGLSINEVTGELNQSTDAVERYVEALFKQAEVEAYQERIKELTQEQVDINNTLIEQEEAYNEAVKKNEDAWNEYYAVRDEYQAAYDEWYASGQVYMSEELQALGELMEANKAYAEQVSEETFGQIKGYESLQEQVNSTGEEIQEYKDLLMDTTAEQSATDAMDGMSQSVVSWRGYAVEATGDVSTKLEELEQAYGEAKTAAEDSLRSQMGLFDEYTIESQSLDDMTKGLESQTDAMTQYGDNLQKALDLNIDPQIIASIEEMGISGAGYLQALVDAAEEGGAAMDDFMAAWEANQEALNGLSEAMAEFEVGYGETLGRVVETGEESAQTMLEDQEAFSEQYVQSWDDTGAAVALSIEESQPIVIENVKTMASMAVTTLNSELGIADGKSSKGYDAGQIFGGSMADGIKSKEDEIVDAVASVGRKAYEEAKEWSRKVNEALGEDL